MVASLAENLDRLTQVSPRIRSQLHDLSQRTQAMEVTVAKAVGKSSALRQPLASSAFPGSLPAASLQDLLREMPTRRGAAPPSKHPKKQ